MVGEYSNQYLQLRAQRLALSTREFLARGKSVVRCEACQLAVFACLCPWRPELAARSEFVLLMHTDEVFKPTNTGRLIADILPRQTHAFCWSRTQPAPELLALLSDPQRRCLIVFPVDASDASAKPRQLIAELPDDGKINTFVVLDGTWKQSGRMFHLSRWLENIPCVILPEALVRGYAVRKSHQEHYLSTAEAASLCLEMAGEPRIANALQDYFQLFNVHYLATRGAVAPVVGELHKRMEAYKKA
ncbi:tRNA-uridine aminocarboxypropyltransferase [Cellvibrio sp. OA-2007]|uniref:tRNA-uridine aminocarboxypropyltransferase n=1 Tax=Cellvibrio sp. OA-2007 TaxID=529823 RepID=UPI000784D43B|nr:DTW domain-containing protein [Cellvibrio sp. OA-2007]